MNPQQTDMVQMNSTAVSEADKFLRSPELLPMAEADRKLSLLDYTLLWAGMTISIAGFGVGAQLYLGGMSSPTILLGVLVAYLLVTALSTLIGDIGTRYGVPFTVVIRSSFGHKGSILAGLLRSIPCFFWFGFQTWAGALALNTIINTWTGFDNLTLFIIIFAIAQILNALYGLEAQAKFDWIAVPALAIVLVALMVWLLYAHNATLPDVLGAAGVGTPQFGFPFAVAGIAGGWITMTLNAPDLSRQIPHRKNWESMSFLGRNRDAIIGQILGLVIVGALILIVGTTSGILTGDWNPITVAANSFSNKPVITIICLLAIAFAQWSTNTTANLMPPAYILLNIFPKMRFWMTTIISGVIGLVIMPWMFADYLVQFQALSSSLLGPIVGIMLSDYYVIRKGKLNVQGLYTKESEFNYVKGFNPAAILSLVLAFGLALLTGDYAFFAGLILSAVFYIAFMRFYELKKRPQDLDRVVEFKE